MNAQQLQALINLNATKISDLHNTVEDLRVQAAYDFSRGNTSFALDSLAKARKVQRGSQMRKAVELQRQLKAELSSIHREARIARKLVVVKALGAVCDEQAWAAMTSFEQEDSLDRVMSMLVMPKPDSRQAA